MNESLVTINGGNVPTLELLFLLTIIALLPSIVIMMTSFTRTIIILSFLRNALGIQQTPPNMVLVGISLFLTLFIMNPVISTIQTEAYEPYINKEISDEEAVQRMKTPIKEFMLKQTELDTLHMFQQLSGTENVEDPKELSLVVIIPSFMTSELKRAFIAGFLLFLPFLLIDIIVSTTLMSMGMMMLPPAMISLPFKILLFVSVDGWNLLFESIAKSFR